MNLDLKDFLFKSIRKGQNVSVFGMEASGHNTETEKVLGLRNDNEYLGIIDCRKIMSFDENEVKRDLFLSVKSQSVKGSVIPKLTNFDDLIYAQRLDWSLYILTKNLEFALASFPQLITFLKNISKVSRSNTALIFTGNHHALRQESNSIADADIFLENVFIHSPMDQEQLGICYEECSIPRPFKLTNEELQRVYSISGGNPSIIKGIAKYLNSARQKPLGFDAISLWNKNEVAVRLENIANSMNEPEMTVLETALNVGPIIKTQEEPVDILSKVGVVDNNGLLFSPIFANYLRERYLQRTISIEIIEGQVVAKNPTHNLLLTSSENSLLLLLLNNRNIILERDAIFNFVWRDDIDKYSDWNLDQLVRRLRTKLKPHRLDQNILTVKGRGIMWYENKDTQNRR